jgi:hypothetical protein
VVGVLRAHRPELKAQFDGYVAEHQIPSWIAERATPEAEYQILRHVVGDRSE